MPIVLQLKNVGRTFSGASDLTILENVHLEVASGDAVALRGPSGCGKSTLLYIAGTLDKPTEGTVSILGENPWGLSSSKLAGFRNQHIGFVFQEHQLLPQCSVLENVLLPTLAGFDNNRKVLRERAEELLSKVGMQERMTHRPAALSGGERQRVAVCRAMIHQPSLLLADEPTGNLDPETAEMVGQLLLDLASEHDAALLCVTHSDDLAARFPNAVQLENKTINYSTSK